MSVAAAGEVVLSLRGLTKIYARRASGVVGVEDLTFEVRRGEIVALLGPNGAGKTTSMLLALGLLQADSGQVELFSSDPELLDARRRVGYAPDAPMFPRQLTGLQVLELHGALAGLSRVRARSRASELVTMLGLADFAGRACALYSKGQAQRLGLAQALIGEPELLFLDEPTAGLDPAAVAALRALLSSLQKKGTAIVLNSHLLSEVERICDRVLFIKDGRLLRTHQMHAGGQRAELRLANPAQVAARLKQVLPDGVLDGDRFRVPIAAPEVMPALVRQVADAGGEVLEARLAGAELEELYMQIVEGRS